MPEDFEGGRSVLPFLLASAPIGVYAWSKRDALAAAMGGPVQDPISKVVGGRTKDWFAGMAGWAPNIAEIDPALHNPILQAFKRRVGTSTGLGAVSTLQGAVEATQEFPALKSILRQSIQEFRGVDPSTIGAPIGMARNKPVIEFIKNRAVTNSEAVSRALSRNELGLSSAQRASLRSHLEELAAVTRDMMDTVPTFSMSQAGDQAISEMMVTLHRSGGPVSMRVPLPSAEGALTTQFGTRYYARKVLGDVPGFLATGVAGEMDVGTYALQRLRQLVTEKQGAISQRDIKALQQEIRKQLIYTGDERGVLASQVAGRTYAEQMYVPRHGATPAQRLEALERLRGMGRGAGLTPDALSKGMVWTEAGAAKLPYGGLTTQHYTQAMTKAQVAGGGGAPAKLFQVAPSSAELAAKQLGMESIRPRQDVIMMGKGFRTRMRTGVTRPVTIDPTLPAAKRFEKIQRMLMDNETTRAMLDGGQTIEEAMATYQGLGKTYRQRLAEAATVGEGEFLGFTKSGPVFAKTYGTKTMIRDIKTVGGKTEVTLGSYYDPQKVFSTGGIKHTLEYADPEAIRKLGIRAKALELLKAQGVDVEGIFPLKPSMAMRLRKAEQEAAAMYGGAQGLVVEGAGWEAWEKYRGVGKNVGRFNELIEDKWKAAFGDLPAGYYETENLMKRRGILARELARRGEKWSDWFAQDIMATRTEILRPGPAAEMLGIGRAGTFTDDAFRVFKMFGWNDIAADVAKRVERDVPLQNLLEQATIATRGEGTGIPLAEIARRPGGINALIEDAGMRAQFMEEAGGIIQLPQTYKVAGKEVTQIAVPYMGTGYTGYFTTAEGREIQKTLDTSLRSVLTAAQADIGAVGVPAGELAAAGALEEYFGTMANIATRSRDKFGGRVQGSLTFAIGRDIAEDVMTKSGEMAPFGAISRETFEDWVAQNLRSGMIDQSMAKEQRRLFKMGRLPVKAIKHPARGPLSTSLFYLGEAPRAAELGWAAERNFVYLSEKLLKPFVADLDFDPLPVDMFTSREALQEATNALENGKISQMIERHRMLREEVMGAELKGGRGKGVRAWFQDKWDTRFQKERAARDAASKSEVGIFTSRVAWPLGAAMEEAGLSFEEKFDALFWAEIMEEKTTLKARHDFTIASGTAEEIAQALQSGRHKILQDKTREVLGLRSGKEGYFDSLLERLSNTWKNMSAERRSELEAKFAGKGTGTAKTWMRLAASDTIAATHAGVKGSTGFAGQAVRAFEGLGNVVRAHKRTALMVAGAGALAGMLLSRRRDLTPEAVTSGEVAGGAGGNNRRFPMPRIEKGLYYNKGQKPGYRININLSKEIDHKTLADQLSQITGDGPVNININDSRKRITRHQIEREMHQDRMLGALRPSGNFYNSSRYQ